ncbi:MAG: GNAT family N-acetyltransferase [Anaerolineales bacterium]|nr:GNAT family N-acetyltransferase [Anaerolineales bacterium]
MTPPLIREAQPDDAGPFLTYIQRLITEPDINIPLTPDEFKFTLAEERQILADYAAAANSVFLVAEVGGEMVGQLSCKGGVRQATRHTAVLGMSVSQAWRGQGVGSRLMAQAVAWAKQTGIVSRLELYVYARNQPAIALYRKFGFEIEGRRRQVIYQNGAYLDDLLMALLL